MPDLLLAGRQVGSAITCMMCPMMKGMTGLFRCRRCSIGIPSHGYESARVCCKTRQRGVTPVGGNRGRGSRRRVKIVSSALSEPRTASRGYHRRPSIPTVQSTHPTPPSPRIISLLRGTPWGRHDASDSERDSRRVQQDKSHFRNCQDRGRPTNHLLRGTQAIMLRDTPGRIHGA